MSLARNMSTIDVLLLSGPTKNIDYPALSLPALLGCLSRHGYSVAQRDLNMEIKDRLLTGESLLALKDRILPALSRENVGDALSFRHISEGLQLLRYAATEWSLEEIQNTKQLMQQRRYTEVFGQEARFDMAICVFEIARFLHRFMDAYIHRPTIFEECGLRDPIKDVLDTVIQSVSRSQPKVIGFTVLDIQRRFTLWFAAILRRMCTSTIVLGGADPSRFGASYLQNFRFLDHVFVKEAEESFPQFLSQLCAPNPRWEAIPGFGFRKDGNVIITDAQPLDPSQIARPDFSGFPLDSYLLPTLPIQASRGCRWHRCKFCIHWQTYSHYYQRSPKDVVDDMQALSSKHSTRFFHFTDDELAVGLGSQVSQEILKRGLQVKWLTYARLEKSFDFEVLSQWHRAGARVMEWGLESASQPVLDLMNKGIEVKDAQPIVDHASRAGLLNKLFCFHNYPGESLDDLKTTIHFLHENIMARKIRPFLPIRNRLFLLKGSTLYQECTSDTPCSHFPKVWRARGPFSIQAEYADASTYQTKKEMISRFATDIHDYMRQNNVFATDDENVTMDLVVADLRDQGLSLSRTSI